MHTAQIKYLQSSILPEQDRDRHPGIFNEVLLKVLQTYDLH